MRVTWPSASVAMKPASMLARVTARFCSTSATCCSALRRRPTSASSEVMAACNWPTLGIFSALGISSQIVTAVAIDSRAVPALASTRAPQ